MTVQSAAFSASCPDRFPETRHNGRMHIVRVALGAIARRGASVIAPSLATLTGPVEQDFLGRHIDKVRSKNQARSFFDAGSTVPALLAGLLAGDDLRFVADAYALQKLLTSTMSRSSNASDCVTALVQAQDQPGQPNHITMLKLDANVEAARRDIFNGAISLTVLSDLLPTPRDLQKALSWPDPRPDSDVLMVDTNAANAQYFENAYDVRVSPKSAEAEGGVRAAIIENVPQNQLSQALQEASALDGPADKVLKTLSGKYPSLAPSAQSIGAANRPAGVVRLNKISAQPVVWRADGVELRVPAHRAADVTVTPDGNGFVLSLNSPMG